MENIWNVKRGVLFGNHVAFGKILKNLKPIDGREIK